MNLVFRRFLSNTGLNFFLAFSHHPIEHILRVLGSHRIRCPLIEAKNKDTEKSIQTRGSFLNHQKVQTGSPSPSGRGQGEGYHGPDVVPKHLLRFARDLRKDQTDAEAHLWAILRNRRLAGNKFRRQHSIPPYVVDFFCNEACLVIEVDGGQHGENRRRDDVPTAFLEEKGLRVIRFWNHEVLQSFESVLEVIRRELQ
ncbi:MAG: endonuclease domain-containing protein [Deltaproteobacteria bacterium]|nr:endonuclease domain-containing protein [Deltaproteobacteria bacterium]